MSVTRLIAEYERGALELLGLGYKGLMWCEFGNMYNSEEKMAAKKVYESYGVHHVSMDLNGKDGSLMIDLDYPVPSEFIGQFDVVTNYGTIEHINNQYQAFKNMHDLCRVGGIMLHVFPMIGHWPRHGRYRYSGEFVTGLADVCGYRIVNSIILDEGRYRKRKNAIAVIYMKKKDKDFRFEEDFKWIEGIEDSGDLVHTGDYTERH